MSIRPAKIGELYNLKNDPDCLNNLAASPDQQARKEQLQAQLSKELKRQKDPRMSGHGDVFEAEPYAGKERNFYERFMRGEKIKTDWVNETDYEKIPVD